MQAIPGAAQRIGIAPSPVHLAKAALRRMALDRVEPTPENYARAYAAESGHAQPGLPERARALLQRLSEQLSMQDAQREALVHALMSGRWDDAQRALEPSVVSQAAQAAAWAETLQRLSRGLERGSRLWTAARKKDSLQRVLSGSGGDAQRLQHRVRRLLATWEGDSDETDAPADAPAAVPADAFADLRRVAPTDSAAPGGPAAADAPPQSIAAVDNGLAMLRSFERALCAGLPQGDARAAELAAGLSALTAQTGESGASADLARRCDELCGDAQRVLAHRQRLLDELGKLCTELTQGLTDLAEDDSWAQGQGELMRTRLADGLNVRNVRAAGELLADTRLRQRALRAERNQARDALKTLIRGMLDEVGEFGEHTGRFHENVGRHAEAIAAADSLDSLTGVVREMVDESRAVQTLVSQTHGRLQAEQARAGEMQARMGELEDELRRLSEEVSTDALTQVANRRGLAHAFDNECARLQLGGGPLAIGLIDIDNFKKLNDSLGHAAGDVALQKLAAQVREQLRPHDTVARFGGEEFVVLMPDTEPADARVVLNRLQRRLTAGLFMHDNKEVFVTFSAGVTALRAGETLEGALQRADEALYEAKRTGKNRACLG